MNENVVCTPKTKLAARPAKVICTTFISQHVLNPRANIFVPKVATSTGNSIKSNLYANCENFQYYEYSLISLGTECHLLDNTFKSQPGIKVSYLNPYAETFVLSAEICDSANPQCKMLGLNAEPFYPGINAEHFPQKLFVFTPTQWHFNLNVDPPTFKELRFVGSVFSSPTVLFTTLQWHIREPYLALHVTDNKTARESLNPNASSFNPSLNPNAISFNPQTVDMNDFHILTLDTTNSNNDDINSDNNADPNDVDNTPILNASPSPLILSTPELSASNDTVHGDSTVLPEISILNPSDILYNLSTPVLSESSVDVMPDNAEKYLKEIRKL